MISTTTTISKGKVRKTPPSLEIESPSSPPEQSPLPIACRHVPSTIDFLKVYHKVLRCLFWSKDLKEDNRQCSQCKSHQSLLSSTLWVCLQCPTFGCWSYSSTSNFSNNNNNTSWQDITISPSEYHLSLHQQGTGHSLALQINTGVVFCLSCKVFIWTDVMGMVWKEVKESPSINSPTIGRMEILAKLSMSSITNHPPNTPLGVSLGDNDEFTSQCSMIRGLWNLGNTCFMNSVLQSLLNCPPLRKLFLSSNTDYSHKRSNCSRSLQKEACMTCELDDLFNSINRDLISPHSIQDGMPPLRLPIAPHNFLQVMWATSSKDMAGYLQQDAHEFFISIRSTIHQHFNCLPEGGGRIGGGGVGGGFSTSSTSSSGASLNMRKSSVTPGINCPCPLHTLFQGFLQSEITCLQCGKSCSSREAFMDLSLDLSNVLSTLDSTISLRDCLENFTREERLTDQKYQCQFCRQTQKNIKKQLTINESPGVLVIHLKRFKNTIIITSSGASSTSTKIDTQILFPEMLDIEDFISSSVDSVLKNQKTNYHLYSVVSHYGKMDSGHYKAHVKDGGQWFLADDARITQCPYGWSDVVRDSNAYMLFYMRNSL